MHIPLQLKSLYIYETISSENDIFILDNILLIEVREDNSIQNFPKRINI